MDSIKKIRDELKKVETEIKTLKKLESELNSIKDTKKTAPKNPNKDIEKCRSKKSLEKFTKADLTKFVKAHKLKVSDCKQKLVKTVWEFLDDSDSSSDSGSSSDESSTDDDSSSDDGY